MAIGITLVLVAAVLTSLATACGAPAAAAGADDSKPAMSASHTSLTVLGTIEESGGGLRERWAALGDEEFPRSYPWSSEEQRQRAAAIEEKDAALLPECSEGYFAWRLEAEKRGLLRDRPMSPDFWSAPGCRGVPDYEVRGPRSGPGPSIL